MFVQQSQAQGIINKLLGTLTQVDNESANLKFQLHASQADLKKAEILCKEQANINSTLQSTPILPITPII